MVQSELAGSKNRRGTDQRRTLPRFCSLLRVASFLFYVLPVLALELHVATKGLMGYEPSAKTADWIEHAANKDRREIKIRGGPCPIDEGDRLYVQKLLSHMLCPLVCR